MTPFSLRSSATQPTLFRALSAVVAASLLLTPLPAVAVSTKGAADPGVHVVGSELASADVQNILAILKDLLQASNQHKLEGVLKHYSPRFVSGDSLSLEEIRHLIEDTWKTYPDIRYESKVLEIRLNGDWATVESLDSSAATVGGGASLQPTSGQLDSRSRGLLFLKKMGATWEIVSDYTIYESATILYGDAKKLKLTLSTPDQVFSGEPYTAKINVTLPNNIFAIASISKEPLVYPQRKPEDKFRSITEQEDTLERVFQANSSNNNEMITATVGLTQISQDDQDRPIVKLNGIATIVKRINVLPKSKFSKDPTLNDVVKTSANGKIDLSKLVTPSPSSLDD